MGFFTPKQGEVIQGSVINFPRSLLIQENQRRGEEKSPVDVVEHRPECLEWWFLSFRKISATSTSAELQNTAFFLRRCYLPFTLKQRNLELGIWVTIVWFPRRSFIKIQNDQIVTFLNSSIEVQAENIWCVFRAKPPFSYSSSAAVSVSGEWTRPKRKEGGCW